jgi:hypothetical protein
LAAGGLMIVDHDITPVCVTSCFAVPNGGLNQDTALWLSYLDRVIACGEGIAESARIKDENARVLAACLLARSISTARAVAHLIGLDHVVEARMLTRSIFENGFCLYRLAQEDGGAFAREMFADEAFYRRVHGQTMLEEEQAREAMGEERQSRIRVILKQWRQKSPNAAPLKPQKVISDTEISSTSVIYQMLSSDAVHPSITALRRHLVGTSWLSLKPQIKGEEMMKTAFLASTALLIVCIAANDAFGRTTVGQRLEGLVAEYNEFGARPLPA